MLADVITRLITGQKYKQTIPLSPMQERAIEKCQIEQKVYKDYKGLQLFLEVMIAKIRILKILNNRFVLKI
ncbi:hypothetical protein RHORCCE3_1852 [Rickettsia hoogstraalii str. RCCE3]|nr:hypothetical protein RHORCCE3_1852 [Rickettsia hoogstraalii str. RCCE3]